MLTPIIITLVLACIAYPISSRLRTKEKKIKEQQQFEEEQLQFRAEVFEEWYQSTDYYKYYH